MDKYKKLRKIGRTFSLIVGAALAALLFTGCLFSPPEEEPVEPPPVMNSPVNVLKTIEIAYNQGNINYYKGALSENFVFYFDPDDVGQTPPNGSKYVIPESWTYTEDWDATQRMFANAYSISLTIPTAGVGEPDPEATTYKAENISIKLLVMIDEVNGFIADTGYCDFEFEEYQNETGADRWRLRKWWDRTATQ